jgi:hypothetical protein
MSLHRRNARRDAGEVAIVHALEGVGATVTRLNGQGVSDLLVGYEGVNHLLEVKAPLGPRGGDSRNDQKLRDTQVTWKDSWRGAQPVVVRSPLEALEAIGALARTL